MTETPPMFLPYQAAWAKDPASFKVCEKGRRIGITWAEAAVDVITAALSKSDGGMDVFYIGYNQDMTREYIDTCAYWVRGLNRAAGEIQESLYQDEEDILAFTIRFLSGNEIMALSSSPRNLRGKQGRVVIDEAAHHDNLPALLKAAVAMTIWGGEIRVISTHDGVENDFALLLERVRSGKRPGSVHRYTFDDAIEQGLCERIFYKQGMEWSQEEQDKWRAAIIDEYGTDADEELFCIPTESGGSYLSVPLIEENMYPAPVLRLSRDPEFMWAPEALRQADVLDWCEVHLLPLLAALPSDRLHAVGQDFGRTGDLSVIAPLTLQQDLVRRCPFLIELRNIPFAQQKQLLWYTLDKLPRLAKVAMDARGNGQQLAEETAQRYGQTRIEQVMFTERTYNEIMPPFRVAFQDGTILVPRDSDVRDDLRAIEVINGIPKLRKVRTGAKKDRHGDAAIALALGYHASRQGHQSFNYTPVSALYAHGREPGELRRVRTTAGFKAHKGIW